MTRRVMVSDLDRRSAERLIELNDSLGRPTRESIRRIAAAVWVDDYDDPRKPYAVFVDDSAPATDPSITA